MRNSFYLNFSSADNLGIGLFKYALFPKEKFIIFNSALPKMLGYSVIREFKDKSWEEVFLNFEEKEKFILQLREKKNIRFFETIFKTKDKKELWVAITASLIKNRNLEYIEGMVENIDEHKKLEEKFFRERDFMQGLLDNLPDAVYFKDTKNRLIKVNKFYAQGIGLKPEEIIGKTDFDFFPYIQAKEMFFDDNYVLSTGKPIIGKIERSLLPDGTWNQVITTKIPIYDQQGKIIGTMGITRDMTAYAHLEQEKLNMVIEALRILEKALQMRDPYTFSHTHYVAIICEEIAKKLNWNNNQILAMKLAGELHDLGKINIPLDILNKPGKLNHLEYNLIKEHVKTGYDLIKDVKFPFPLAEIVLQHHERLDGSGYPRGLKKDEIIFEAKILAVADTLEAMTHHRPYREALGIDKALDELKNGRNLLYEKQIVDLVFEIVGEKGKTPFWLVS